MSQDTLSGLALRDRNFNSFFQDNVPLTDLQHTGSPAVGRVVGGLVASGTPTYANGDGAPFLFTTSGQLKVDTEATITASGNFVVVGNAAHDAVDFGNPVKMGARAQSSQISAVSAADRSDLISDLYGQLVLANHTWASQSNRIEEIDPLSQQYVAEELVDTTNVASGTNTYYPSSAGLSMDGFKDFGIQFGLVCAGGIADTKIEATLDDAASPDWIDVTQAGYRLDTNALGAGSFAVISGTTTGIVDFDELNVRKVRVNLAVNSATNSVQYHIRRKTL